VGCIGDAKSAADQGLGAMASGKKGDSILNTFQRRAHSITSADLGHGAGPRGLQELGRRQQTLIPAQARTQFVQPVFLKNNQINQVDFRVSAERSIAMSVSKSCASQ
jgi:hypothetical protein